MDNEQLRAYADAESRKLMAELVAGRAGASGLDDRPQSGGGPLTCPRGCPDGECYCPLPGEYSINPACGHLDRSRCDGCGTCTTCDGCYCDEP